MKDYYLALEATANIDDKKTYRSPAKKYHSDSYSGDKEKGRALFQKITEAYGGLSNLVKERIYDTEFEDEMTEAKEYQTALEKKNDIPVACYFLCLPFQGMEM